MVMMITPFWAVLLALFGAPAKEEVPAEVIEAALAYQKTMSFWKVTSPNERFIGRQKGDTLYIRAAGSSRVLWSIKLEGIPGPDSVALSPNGKWLVFIGAQTFPGCASVATASAKRRAVLGCEVLRKILGESIGERVYPPNYLKSSHARPTPSGFVHAIAFLNDEIWASWSSETGDISYFDTDIRKVPTTETLRRIAIEQFEKLALKSVQEFNLFKSHDSYLSEGVPREALLERDTAFLLCSWLAKERPDISKKLGLLSRLDAGSIGSDTVVLSILDTTMGHADRISQAGPTRPSTKNTDDVVQRRSMLKFFYAEMPVQKFTPDSELVFKGRVGFEAVSTNQTDLSRSWEVDVRTRVWESVTEFTKVGIAFGDMPRGKFMLDCAVSSGGKEIGRFKTNFVLEATSPNQGHRGW